MKFLKFLITYLRHMPIHYWLFWFCMPNLYSKYPHDASKGRFNIKVYRVYFRANEVVNKVVEGSKNKAYIKLRYEALRQDFRTPQPLGVEYGMSELEHEDILIIQNGEDWEQSLQRLLEFGLNCIEEQYSNLIVIRQTVLFEDKSYDQFKIPQSVSIKIRKTKSKLIIERI